MRNAATLLNLVELSVAVASIPAGLIVKGTQAAGKCAAVLPGKASSGIKINRSATHKPVAKAKASALPKALEKCWQPWQVSTPAGKCQLMVVLLSALAAMACVACVSEHATFFASARGAQPVLHTNTTGNPDVVSCHSGIDPLSDMADTQSALDPLMANDQSTLAFVKKTTLLVRSSLEESASLFEQVTTWLLGLHAVAPYMPRLFALLHLGMPHLPLPLHAARNPFTSHFAIPSLLRRHAALSETGPKHVAVLKGRD